MGTPTNSKTKANGTLIGFEAKLWLATDKLRNNMAAAEYKHVVLDAKLIEGNGDYADSNPEDADEYRAENVFWVPIEARWPHLQPSAKQSAIGKVVDEAEVALERDNVRLKGVLPKDYARPGLDKHRLGELIGTIGLGDAAPLFEQAEANRTESRTLATLRETLLPKLFSGDIAVGEFVHATLESTS